MVEFRVAELEGSSSHEEQWNDPANNVQSMESRQDIEGPCVQMF